MTNFRLMIWPPKPAGRGTAWHPRSSPSPIKTIEELPNLERTGLVKQPRGIKIAVKVWLKEGGNAYRHDGWKFRSCHKGHDLGLGSDEDLIVIIQRGQGEFRFQPTVLELANSVQEHIQPVDREASRSTSAQTLSTKRTSQGLSPLTSPTETSLSLQTAAIDDRQEHAMGTRDTEGRMQPINGLPEAFPELDSCQSTLTQAQLESIMHVGQDTQPDWAFFGYEEVAMGLRAGEMQPQVQLGTFTQEIPPTDAMQPHYAARPFHTEETPYAVPAPYAVEAPYTVQPFPAMQAPMQPMTNIFPRWACSFRGSDVDCQQMLYERSLEEQRLSRELGLVRNYQRSQRWLELDALNNALLERNRRNREASLLTSEAVVRENL